MPIKESNQNPLEMLAEMSGNSGRKHSVPQNVMDVEFKVVGDLTLRQLGFLCLGGVFGYLFYNSGLPSFWALTLAGFFVILGVAIAFLPIEERPLDKWLMLFIKAMGYETQLIWRKSSVIPAYFLSDYADIIKNELITLTPIKSRSKLDDYLGQLPEDQDSMDLYQASKMSQISSTFESQMQKPAKLATDSKAFAIKETPLGFSRQRYSFKKSEEKSSVKEAILKDEKETKELLLNVIKENPLPVLTSTPKPAEKSEVVSKNSNIVVDRPIKNWPKKYESQIKGEIKIKTTAKLPLIIVAEDIKEISQQEVSLEKKIEELMAVASKAKKELEGQGLNLDSNDRIEFFRNKYHELKQEKDTLKTELEKNTSRVSQIDEEHKKKDLEDQVKNLTNQNEDLEQKLQFIQDQLFILKNQNKQPAPANTPTNVDNIAPIENKIATETASVQKMGFSASSLRSNTNNIQVKESVASDNIIYGTVKDQHGVLSENTVVLIKDIKGNVARALKTNKLGQFKTQTPVQNGSYLIEAIKGGDSFDIIRVEASGTKINPVYLIGKPK